MAAFDPKTFLDLTVTEQGSTEIIPIPVGDYVALIEKVNTRAWQKRDDPSVNGIALDVTYNLELTSAVKEIIGRDKAVVTQGITLDLTESGGLDMGKGKNVGLNRLREAVGLNRAGAPFNFRMLEGQAVKIKLGHRAGDEGQIYHDVKAVSKV